MPGILLVLKTGIPREDLGVHNAPPSRYHRSADLAARPLEDARLAGGKTADELLGYLKGVDFPTKKAAIIRAARRNGAPEDVLGAPELLPANDPADEGRDQTAGDRRGASRADILTGAVGLIT